MNFKFSCCPRCFLHSYSSIEVVIISTSIDDNIVKCKNCGWIGKRKDMSYYEFNYEKENQYE